MEPEALRKDLEFLVNHPDKSLASTYHDAGRCWQLIEAALDEIRALRKQLEQRGAEAERRPPRIGGKA